MADGSAAKRGLPTLMQECHNANVHPGAEIVHMEVGYQTITLKRTSLGIELCAIQK